MHVSHPAAHEDAQPHHQQVFHLDARETTLEGKEDTGEGQDSARVSDGWTRTTLQTSLSPGETLSLFYIYIHQSIMQLLLQVGHLKFPKSGEIRAQGCVELDAAHPHTRELQLRVPALLPLQGQSPLPSGTPGAARGSAPAQGDPSQQIPHPLQNPTGTGESRCQLPVLAQDLERMDDTRCKPLGGPQCDFPFLALFLPPCPCNSSTAAIWPPCREGCSPDPGTTAQIPGDS